MEGRAIAGFAFASTAEPGMPLHISSVTHST